MTVPTLAEQNLLKSRPHSSQWWLSIYDPQVALACQVNNVSIAKGARTIAYDGVTTGSYQLVEADFIMLVGTTAGDDDKGRIRVRSIDATQITVAENSHINWADGDYLTILRYVEIVPKFTRIIQNPADEMDVIFYKDYDVAYTNQNTLLGAFPSVGCHYAGFLGENGTGTVYYSSEGTYHAITGTALTYDWWFEGSCGITGSASATPGYIPYNTPGSYVTRTIITGDNGSTDTTYRFVSIYDHPSRGTQVPVLDWSIKDIHGSRDAGGYTGRIQVRTDISNIVRDNSLIVIFSEDWYGSTIQSVGGNSPNRSTIKFVGYVLAGTIEYNYRDNYVEFDVGTASEVMLRCEGFSVSVESKVTASTWYELDNMNCKKALYHYLKWHSTVLGCTDFEYGGSDYLIQYFDADRTSLYDAIQNLMDGTLFGSVVSDMQGKLWAEIDYVAISNGAGLSTTMAIDKMDWMGQPSFDSRVFLDTSFIEMGGIKYDGPAAGTYQALLCDAPGTAPAYQGKVDRVQGLALASQAHLNTVAGNVWAHLNSEYPGVTLKLSGNYSIYDIAPQELAPLSMSIDDNPLGIAFTNKNFVVIGKSLTYDAKLLSVVTTIDLAEVVPGVDADTVIIPDPPSDGGGAAPIPTPGGVGNITPGATTIIYSSGTASVGAGVSLYGRATYASDGSPSAAFAFISEYYDTHNYWTSGSSVTFVNNPGQYLITSHVQVGGSRSGDFGGNPFLLNDGTNFTLRTTLDTPTTNDSVGITRYGATSGTSFGPFPPFLTTDASVGLILSGTFFPTTLLTISNSLATPAGVTWIVEMFFTATKV